MPKSVNHPDDRSVDDDAEAQEDHRPRCTCGIPEADASDRCTEPDCPYR